MGSPFESQSVRSNTISPRVYIALYFHIYEYCRSLGFMRGHTSAGFSGRKVSDIFGARMCFCCNRLFTGTTDGQSMMKLS